MPRIYFTLYWAGATLVVAALLVLGIMVGRAEASVVTSHIGFETFTVTGAIPQPIEIIVGFSWDIGGGPLPSPDPAPQGASINWLISTRNSVAGYGIVQGTTGFREGGFDNMFVLSDLDRVVNVSILAQAYGGTYTVNDAYVSFNLPDNLSVAAVPESATWVMLILAFGFISLFHGKKFWGLKWS